MPVLPTVLGTLLASSGCGEAGTARAQEPRTLMLTGSSTIAPLAAEIAKRFEREHEGVRVDVQTGGSSRGISDARRGRADIGMSSRALTEDEAEGLASHVIAWDGVAFVVHADNPVSALSDDQLRGIFTGALRNWREVGGADADILVVSRAEGHAELELVTQYWDIEATDIRADVISKHWEIAKTVADNPHAITYLSIGISELEIGRGTKLKLLPLRGVAASRETVRRGEFPLARPLVLITRTVPGELARDFVVYAKSRAVRELVEGLSFIHAD